ncbi:MAG: ISL3 family transposase, partial [Opitutales bacterium]|nr:ISL3 family transposase [Opitutales bacterium]
MPECLCGSRRLIHYDTYWRKIKHVSDSGAVYHLRVKCRRYKCLDCGRVFREKIEGLRPYCRHSERFRARMVKDYSRNVCNKDIASEYGVSESTVERAIHRRYESKLREQLSYECPEVIGIDEHTIHKGYKFATTIADLSHHRVYDVIEGKSRSLVEEKLMAYKGRGRVKVVCMDLSSGYRTMVRRYFPNAKIVADRFHVIRLVLYHFMEFCKAAQEEVKWNRRLIYPLRKRGDRLKPEERDRLKKFFEDNPAIKLAYEFKERLCELLNRKSQTAKQCKVNIRELKGMMRQMKYEATREFESLAETISEWFSPIIRMWRFTKNNGITEGFHRKMKLIQRRAYGYRNFENYRLRVLVECGVKL